MGEWARGSRIRRTLKIVITVPDMLQPSMPLHTWIPLFNMVVCDDCHENDIKAIVQGSELMQGSLIEHMNNRRHMITTQRGKDMFVEVDREDMPVLSPLVPKLMYVSASMDEKTMGMFVKDSEIIELKPNDESLRFPKKCKTVTYGDETVYTVNAKEKKSKTKSRFGEVGAAHRYLTRDLDGQHTECNELFKETLTIAPWNMEAPTFTDEQRRTHKEKGFGVLVFLPGAGEVERLYSRLDYDSWDEERITNSTEA